jgi:uncharacterized metal-binding protein YceD (DUF177 family)
MAIKAIIDTEIQVTDISKDAKTYRYEASPADLSAIVERFNIVSLEKLIADLSISRKNNYHGVWIEGRIQASLTQQCVATLGDVPETIDEEFELLLADEATVNRFDEDQAYLDENVPDYDLLDDEKVIPAEVAIQTLSIMMNPYPRKDGAAVEIDDVKGVTANEPELKKPNPFTVLEGLKDKS